MARMDTGTTAAGTAAAAALAETATAAAATMGAIPAATTIAREATETAGIGLLLAGAGAAAGTAAVPAPPVTIVDAAGVLLLIDRPAATARLLRLPAAVPAPARGALERVAVMPAQRAAAAGAMGGGRGRGTNMTRTTGRATAAALRRKRGGKLGMMRLSLLPRSAARLQGRVMSYRRTEAMRKLAKAMKAVVRERTEERGSTGMLATVMVMTKTMATVMRMSLLRAWHPTAQMPRKRTANGT